MNTEWQYKKLGKVTTIISGQSPEGRFYNHSGDGLPFYQGKKEFTEKFLGEPTVWTQFSTKIAEKGDILMSVRAPVGPVNFATQKICIGRGLAAIRVSEGLDENFLFYFLHMNELKFSGNNGAVFPSINKSQIADIQIPLPPLPEQQRIVKILDEAFGAIEKAKENVERNVGNAEKLYELLLENSLGGLENHGEEKTLDAVCDIQSKLIDPRKSEFLDLIHVGAGNIEAKTGKLIDLKTSREEKLISGKFQFDESMILYSKIRPYLMKVVRPNFSGLCSADIYPLMPRKGMIMRNYLFYLLLSKKFTEFAIKGSARAGMPKVNREHLFSFNFSLPPIPQQRSIVARLDALSVKTKKLEAVYQRKLACLEELKKSLLQKAFAGEL